VKCPDTYPVFLIVFVHIYVSNLARGRSRNAWKTLEEDADAIFLG
jgi:hypothetical protein